jgi:tetratricopeptide (TPR) repeat protein
LKPLVAIAAVLLSVTLAGAQGAAQAAYERANRLFNERQFQESMNALDEALRIDPKLVPALTLRARLAMAIERSDIARDSLERAIAADPSSWYARFLYGFYLYHQNEMPSAIAALEKARELNPRAPEPALYLGLAYESLARTADALTLYRRAVALEESTGRPHVETLLTLSRLLLLLGSFDECGRVIERAEKVDPNSRDPHFEAGRLLLKKGEPAKAAEEGETALRLKAGDTTDRQAHFLLVQAYRGMGRDADAERHAAAVRDLDKTSKK